jgi:hypothetical protein
VGDTARSELANQRGLAELVKLGKDPSGAKGRHFKAAFTARLKVVPFQNGVYATSSSVVSLKFVEEQMQVLRLRLPRKTRQTSLRMTDHYDANF